MYEVLNYKQCKRLWKGTTRLNKDTVCVCGCSQVKLNKKNLTEYEYMIAEGVLGFYLTVCKKNEQKSKSIAFVYSQTIHY